jgi:hypothetical protein
VCSGASLRARESCLAYCSGDWSSLLLGYGLREPVTTRLCGLDLDSFFFFPLLLTLTATLVRTLVTSQEVRRRAVKLGMEWQCEVLMPAAKVMQMAMAMMPTDDESRMEED